MSGRVISPGSAVSSAARALATTAVAATPLGAAAVAVLPSLTGQTSASALLSQQAQAKASLPGKSPALLKPMPGLSSELNRSSIPFISYPAPGAAASTVLSYTVQRGYRAFIKQIAVVNVSGQPVDGTGQVIWRCKQNAGWIEGLEYMTAQLGQWSIPQPLELPIVLNENDVFQVTVEVPSGQSAMPAGSTTGARILGWVTQIKRAAP